MCLFLVYSSWAERYDACRGKKWSMPLYNISSSLVTAWSGCGNQATVDVCLEIENNVGKHEENSPEPPMQIESSDAAEAQEGSFKALTPSLFSPSVR